VSGSLRSLAGILAAFLWGLAEAIFFFVIPDELSFVAILDWPRTRKHVLAAVAGALLGGAPLFHWASGGFRRSSRRREPRSLRPREDVSGRLAAVSATKAGCR